MVLIEGKTKVIRQGEKPDEVIMETKDELTGGDAAKRETISGIAIHKTTQASNVFRLLERNGIATAFLRQGDERSMICQRCDMLPLELVMRRYAWGSILKRQPELRTESGAPHRFEDIELEMFHKRAVVMPPLVEEPVQMDEGEARERYLRDGVWPTEVHTDPMIRIDERGRWMLYSAKEPVASAKPLMETEALLDGAELEALRSEIMVPVFESLERAWAGIDTVDGPVALADIKIEVGRSAGGKLVVADVIDNDSWRIWPGADPSRQLDKQCFREDHPLQEVAEKYELVAGLSQEF